MVSICVKVMAIKELSDIQLRNSKNVVFLGRGKRNTRCEVIYVLKSVLKIVNLRIINHGMTCESNFS